MNFRESLLSDDDNPFTFYSGQNKAEIVPEKSSSAAGCRKFRTSSGLDSDEDEEDSACDTHPKLPKSLNYSSHHGRSLLSTKNTKRSVLEKLAQIGSQKPSLPMSSSSVLCVGESEDEDQVQERRSLKRSIVDTDSDSEEFSVEGNEERLSSVKDSDDDDGDFLLSDEEQETMNKQSPLKKLLARQASVLKDLRVSAPRKKAKMTKAEVLKSASKEMSIEDFWNIELSFLAPDFFKSQEAKMEILKRVRKGVRAYEGLRITHENSYDMKAVYEVDFAPSIKAGHYSKTYEQFKITVGQYARMCVTLKKCKAMSLCEPGNLFRLFCNKSLAEAFLGYFQIRAAPATVTHKANTLVRLADSADMYFRTEKPELSAKAEVAARFIRKTSASHKKLTRHRMEEKQDLNRRIAEGRLFSEADFSMCPNRAASILKKCTPSIKKYVSDYKSSSNQEQGGLQSPISFEKQIVSLINKWCINLLCLLMMNGAGQRPQVYAELSLPNYSKVKRLREEASENGYFELSTIHEKTTRNIDCPYVIFPASTFQFVSFHVKYVRDIILRITKVDESKVLLKTLLLHTKTGFPLESGQVSRTLKLFLKNIDPELCNVSPMTLRASYATMMLQKYRSGLLMAHKTEHQFLEYLAKVMNTSVEQLSSTYASSSRASFRDCAKEVARIMDSNCDDRIVEVSDDEDSA